MLIIITVLSLAAAVIMTIVAWRMFAEEERRSAARVAALAAEIGAPNAPAGAAHNAAAEPNPAGARSHARAGSSIAGSQIERDLGQEPSARDDRDRAGDVAAAPLFAATAQPARRSRVAAAIAVAVFVAGSGAALAVVLSGSSSASRAGAATAPAPNANAPLELVTLTHERDGDALAIHGIVHNPADAPPIDGLTAVVFLFDRSGNFSTSTRAPLDGATLAPGDDARFRVVVPDAQQIGRYRVSFRTDRGIVAHVDRRRAGQEGR